MRVHLLLLPGLATHPLGSGFQGGVTVLSNYHSFPALRFTWPC